MRSITTEMWVRIRCMFIGIAIAFISTGVMVLVNQETGMAGILTGLLIAARSDGYLSCIKDNVRREKNGYSNIGEENVDTSLDKTAVG